MKLPDFREDQDFERLRESMGAPYQEWEAKGWDTVKSDDLLDLLGTQEGIELGDDLSLLSTNPDGTFAYEGYRVLVYIRDQWYWPSDPDREYKFHLSRCRTIAKMFEGGRKNRYVVTTNTSGEFYVRVVNRSTNAIREEGPKRMRVCKNCLNHLNYKGYGGARGARKNEIYEGFSIDEFFEAFGGTKIDDLPDYDERSAPRNEYPKNWDLISRVYREMQGWRCESCTIDLSRNDHRAWLHTHHRNHLRNDNNGANLQALCIGCHAEQPDHRGLKHTPQYAAFRRAFPQWRPQPRA